MSAMLQARDLVKRFGPITAVDGISLTVQTGEVLGFLGPNGAGKTTTMKMLTGFLVPTSGEAFVCGHSVAEAPLAAKRHIGYLPEGAPAYGDMTPAGFLDFVAEVRGLSGAERSRAVGAAVEAVHLAGVMNQPIETLSKGFRRRVGLAQAILHTPDVLILDEPTDGLDPNQKHEVRALIGRMAERTAVVISTHILEEVDAVCSRAVVIDRGRIVADGTPAGLKARSRYHNAVTVTLDAALADTVEPALAGIDAVAGVERVEDGDKVLLTALTADGREALEPVRELAASSGWAVEQIAVDPGRLDDVFRAVTHTDAPSAEPEGESPS